MPLLLQITEYSFSHSQSNWYMSFYHEHLESKMRKLIFVKYDITQTVKILLSPLRLHSASSIQIPQSTNRYNSMLPSAYVSPLKLHSATKINLHGVSDSALFRNHLKVRLSPLKSPVLRNSRSKYRRSVVYPSISKCNAKRCSCCKH